MKMLYCAPSFVIAPTRVRKSTGEGSRGGRVIGHTKSGKPVYAGAHPTNHVYRDFSPKDHDDAADLHLATPEYERHYESVTDTVEGLHHQAMADGHVAQIDIKKQAIKDAKRKRPTAAAKYDAIAELGPVLGRTSSGKVVYDNLSGDHPAYSHFSIRDHNNAAAIHEATLPQFGLGLPPPTPDQTARLRRIWAHDDKINDIKYARQEKALGPSFKMTGDSAAGMGRTRTGKSVLLARDASSPHYAEFTAGDHADAHVGHLSAADAAKSSGRGRAEALHRARAASHLAASGGNTNGASFKPAVHRVAFNDSKKSMLFQTFCNQHFMLSKADGHAPPQGVRSACARGLKLVPEYGGDGLTAGAKARARSMANGGSVSMANIKRMKAFFARHTEAKTASPPSPGYVAYLLWGGAAGKAWANKMAQDADGTSKSFYLPARLVKGGEGSRGGHIIGHTKSGKPVYDHHNKRYTGVAGNALSARTKAGKTGAGIADKALRLRQGLSAEPEFTQDDHLDAKILHAENAKRFPARSAERNAALKTAQVHSAAWFDSWLKTVGPNAKKSMFYISKDGL